MMEMEKCVLNIWQGIYVFLDIFKSQQDDLRS